MRYEDVIHYTVKLKQITYAVKKLELGIILVNPPLDFNISDFLINF